MNVLERMRESRANRQRRVLYDAVWDLPRQSRMAMLAALEDEELIVGAYASRRGGICPMLAAHRRGARAVVGSFPGAWDRFARARRPRRATPREIEILRAVLEESLTGSSEADPAPGVRLVAASRSAA
jgi:hypothetical protein